MQVLNVLSSMLGWGPGQPAPPQPSGIQAVSSEMWIDLILPRLDIRDIVRLGLVCRWLHDLVRHKSVWSRLLRETRLPIPPLPPTKRYALESLTALETERLVVRAHTYEHTWTQHSEHLAPCTKRRFNTALRVKSMCLLPGSKYMLASTTVPNSGQWSISVWELGETDPRLVVQIPTITKAYGLQARYGIVSGMHGIIVAYLRRGWKFEQDADKGLDISEYSGEYDVEPPYPVMYECQCIFLRLDHLQQAKYVTSTGNVLFQRLAVIRSPRRLGPMTLDDTAGLPYLCLAHPEKNRIFFRPLFWGKLDAEFEEHCEECMLTLENVPEYAGAEHRIRAIRLLPQQKEILIIREIFPLQPTREKHPITSMEIHFTRLNEAKYTSAPSPDDTKILRGHKILSVQITQHGTPPWTDESVGSLFRPNNDFTPNPLHVYITVSEPVACVKMYTFLPTIPALDLNDGLGTENRPDRYDCWNHFYSFDRCREQLAHFGVPAGFQLHVIPGCFRTLFFDVRWPSYTESMKVLHFWRYYSQPMESWHPFKRRMQFLEANKDPVSSNDAGENDMQVDTNATTVEQIPNGDFDMSEEFNINAWMEPLPFNNMGGRFLNAFAWDETIGRLCFTEEGTNYIYVWDFSRAPEIDELKRRIPVPVHHVHDEISAQAEAQYEEYKNITEYF